MIIAAWIKANVSVGGTGALTLTRIAGYPYFWDHPDMLDGVAVPYVVLDSASRPLEAGNGIISTSGADKILTRTSIRQTWVDATPAYDLTAPAALDIAAGSIVMCGLLPSHIKLRGNSIADGATGRIACNAVAAETGTSALALATDTIYHIEYDPSDYGGLCDAICVRSTGVTGTNKITPAVVSKDLTTGEPGKILWQGAEVTITGAGIQAMTFAARPMPDARCFVSLLVSVGTGISLHNAPRRRTTLGVNSDLQTQGYLTEARAYGSGFPSSFSATPTYVFADPINVGFRAP